MTLIGGNSCMEKVKSVGSVLLTVGIISYLLSLVNLEFKALSILGEYKLYAEISSVVIGLILILFAKIMNKNDDEKQE